MLALLIGLVFVLTAIDSDVERDEEEPPVASLATLYLNMKNSKRTASNIYLLSYMLRRAIFGVVVVLMEDYPAL